MIHDQTASSLTDEKELWGAVLDEKFLQAGETGRRQLY